MILLTLIKKELLQFFRNKSDVVVMFIFPIVLIAVLGSTLNGLMERDINLYEDKIIYYRINNVNQQDEELKVFYNFMAEFETKTNSNFIEINDKEKSIREINENKAICLVDIYKDDYNYYRNEDKESTESKIFRNIYEQYLKKYNLIKSIKKKNPQDLNSILNKQINISLINQGIGSKKVNSFTYYTFAELILIILYISNLTSTSMYREKYLNTMTRMRISKAKDFQIILSKIISGVIVGLLQIALVYIISTRFLNVDWGEHIFKIFEVLISLIIFSSVLGIFISMVCKDEKTSYSVLNSFLIVMGFLTGSYVPVCLIKSISVTNFLSNLIPSYWANVAIIGLSHNITTYYSNLSIIICLMSSIILFIIGYVISKLKVGGSFD